jgi:hypothetical protein
VRYQGNLAHYKYFRKLVPPFKIEYILHNSTINIKSTKNNIQTDIDTLNHNKHETTLSTFCVNAINTTKFYAVCQTLLPNRHLQFRMTSNRNAMWQAKAWKKADTVEFKRDRKGNRYQSLFQYLMNKELKFQCSDTINGQYPSTPHSPCSERHSTRQCITCKLTPHFMKNLHTRFT